MRTDIYSSDQNSRVEALRQKHIMYEDLIREAQARPSIADFYLRQLKKQKLQIKDALEGSSAPQDETETGT